MTNENKLRLWIGTQPDPKDRRQILVTHTDAVKEPTTARRSW